jgi:uncharacterized short protein YbdD (DUF466 family)
VSALRNAWRRLWSALRGVTGDDAYERYLCHCRERHAGAAPLSRADFYDSELDRRWRQVDRCC